MANHRKKPKIHSVKFNVLMNMLLTTSQMLFPLITLPYVSRILSTFGTGAVAYVQSVVLYFFDGRAPRHTELWHQGLCYGTR